MFGCRVMLASACVSYSHGAPEKPAWHPHFHGSTASVPGQAGSQERLPGLDRAELLKVQVPWHHWEQWQTRPQTLPAGIGLAQHTFLSWAACRDTASSSPEEPTLTAAPQTHYHICSKPAHFSHRKVKSAWVKCIVKKIPKGPKGQMDGHAVPQFCYEFS